MKPIHIVLAGLLAASCAAPPPAPEPTEAPPKPVTSASPRPKEDVLTQAGKAIFRTKKGKKWLMEAFNVRYNQGQQQAHLDNVDWTLSDNKGRKVIRIIAPRAVYLAESERVEFHGTVEARRFPTRDLLKANKMVWDGKTGVLKGSQGVSWVRGVTRVSGDTATTNDKLDRIEVVGNVKVTTVLKGDPFDTGG